MRRWELRNTILIRSSWFQSNQAAHNATSNHEKKFNPTQFQLRNFHNICWMHICGYFYSIILAIAQQHKGSEQIKWIMQKRTMETFSRSHPHLIKLITLKFNKVNPGLSGRIFYSNTASIYINSQASFCDMIVMIPLFLVQIELKQSSAKFTKNLIANKRYCCNSGERWLLNTIFTIVHL